MYFSSWASGKETLTVTTYSNSAGNILQIIPLFSLYFLTDMNAKNRGDLLTLCASTFLLEEEI